VVTGTVFRANASACLASLAPCAQKEGASKDAEKIRRGEDASKENASAATTGATRIVPKNFVRMIALATATASTRSADAKQDTLGLVARRRHVWVGAMATVSV